MRFLDLTLPSLAENLALDEALLLDAEVGGPEILRFWEWPRPAVVLGAACRIADDAIETACRRDNVPIERRASGGGSVLLGSGCLVYTLVLAYERASELSEIPSSYRFILGRMADALTPMARGIERAGISDLVANGRKFSGNSQQRKRHHLLHHGTILYRFDLDLVGRYLHPPKRQPDYRRHREHAVFLVNLPADREGIQRRLREFWAAKEALLAWPEQALQRLVMEKYSQSEWIRRR